MFGSACLAASARNLGAEPKGWPLVSIGKLGADVQVPMCDILDTIRESAKATVTQDVMSRPFGFLLLSSIQQLEELAIHEAMHDAFCLGIAAVSLLEMDFAGVEEIIDEINRGSQNE